MQWSCRISFVTLFMVVPRLARCFLLLKRQPHRLRSTTIMSSSARSDHQPLVLVIAGSTGVGKSDVAARLCTAQPGLIVSADSVQAYPGVAIGANQPTVEERAVTPHLLVDVIDSTSSHYNAAEWRRDALLCIESLLGRNPTAIEEEEVLEEERRRRLRIIADMDQALASKGYQRPVLPVVVGGTMMYLQWLVHGRPDAVRPTADALRKASSTINGYQVMDDWEAAVGHVGSFGRSFVQQIESLSGKDWYRLRRILEVAYTVQESNDPALIDTLYSGQRQGGLASLGFDVRCFFLCPNDRMKHTEQVDRRCEEMIQRGLIQETADLAVAGRLPDMAAKAIGYRQTLDYLQRDAPQVMDEAAFEQYLDVFSTATRRYAKRQMQWFRKDNEFVFLPVDLDQDKAKRVEVTANEITRLLSLDREAFDGERLSSTSSSALTRQQNEAQGKKMKTYQFTRHILLPGSKQLETVLKQADECTHRYQAKKPKRCQETLHR